MGDVVNVQALPTGLLAQGYREMLLALGRDPDNQTLAHKANQYEEELLRRVAW